MLNLDKKRLRFVLLNDIICLIEFLQEYKKQVKKAPVPKEEGEEKAPSKFKELLSKIKRKKRTPKLTIIYNKYLEKWNALAGVEHPYYMSDDGEKKVFM